MAIEFIKIPAYHFDHAHASLNDISALLLQTLNPETREPLSLSRSHIVYTSPLHRAISAIASTYEIIPELREFVFSISEKDLDSAQSMSTLVRKTFFKEICKPSQKAYRQNLVDVVVDLLAKHPEQEITATVLSHTFTLTCIKETLRDQERFVNRPEEIFGAYDPEKKLMEFGEDFSCKTYNNSFSVFLDQ